VRASALAAPRDGEPSIRTGHTKNARPGEPEGLPDLTSTTLTQPARSCQAVAEAGAVDADGVDAGVDRAAALAAPDDQPLKRDVRVVLDLMRTRAAKQKRERESNTEADQAMRSTSAAR
jgi:hypothetical protein